MCVLQPSLFRFKIWFFTTKAIHTLLWDKHHNGTRRKSIKSCLCSLCPHTLLPPVIIMANVFSCFLYVSSGYTLFQNTDLIISPNILLLNILLDKIGVNIQGCIFLLWLKLSLINSQNCDAKYCYFYECLVFLTWLQAY